MAWAEEEGVVDATNTKTVTASASEDIASDAERDASGVISAFRRAVCVLVEECLTDLEARMAQIEAASGIASGRRSSGKRCIILLPTIRLSIIRSNFFTTVVTRLTNRLLNEMSFFETCYREKVNLG